MGTGKISQDKEPSSTTEGMKSVGAPSQCLHNQQPGGGSCPAATSVSTGLLRRGGLSHISHTSVSTGLHRRGGLSHISHTSVSTGLHWRGGLSHISHTSVSTGLHRRGGLSHSTAACASFHGQVTHTHQLAGLPSSTGHAVHLSGLGQVQANSCHTHKPGSLTLPNLTASSRLVLS
jgi:hypothetical protein